VVFTSHALAADAEEGSIMKKDTSLTLDIIYRFVSHISIGNVFNCLLLILFLFPGCAGKMSVEEARQVTISMDKKLLTAPPRRIDDILAVLDQSAQDDLAISQKLRAQIDKPPPQTDNPATLAVYYHRRGDAFVQLGRHSQALADLRQALDYSLQAGGPDHKLLKSLAVAEFSSGNFKHAIERPRTGVSTSATA
jgi:tetratricopeptide (TPR) repeat protein